MAASRQDFVGQWQGRVGEEAANLAVTSARAIGFGALLVPVLSALFVVGYHDKFVLAVATVVAIASAMLLGIGIVRQAQLNAVLTKRFGTKVWFLNSPSLREGQFQAWCGRNGVNPDTGRSSSSVTADQTSC